MSKPFTVAIVGRPNVGKSRLFNRLVGQRVSIVHDMPGVTRDVVTRDLDGYTLMDTGGMGLAPGQSDTPQNLVGAVEAQVELAVAAADFVLMVVDGREGLVPLDYSMAEKLRDAGKPVALVVNKVDTPDVQLEVDDFFALGMGDPLLVSAEHDRGISQLKKAIYQRRDAMAEYAEEAPAEERKVIRVCFIGRPNVGKSSLSNCLVQSERFIVSETPGTTRDSVEMPFTWKSKRGEDWHFALTDTAGIRKKTKLDSSVEYFSRIRSLDAIREVDVVFLVLDAHEGPTAQDKAIAGEAVKANKPMVIVVNKWDLALQAWERGEIRGFDSEQGFRRAFEKGLRREIFFTPGSPIRFVSALQNYEIEKMLYDARQLDKRMGRKIPTGRLNNLIYKLAQRMPAPRMEGKRFRIYYSVHVGNRPYRFKLFCNQSRKLSDGYRRYLQAGIVEEFKLDGCPIVFNLVNKKNPYAEEGGR